MVSLSLKSGNWPEGAPCARSLFFEPKTLLCKSAEKEEGGDTPRETKTERKNGRDFTKEKEKENEKRKLSDFDLLRLRLLDEARVCPHRRRIEGCVRPVGAREAELVVDRYVGVDARLRGGARGGGEEELLLLAAPPRLLLRDFAHLLLAHDPLEIAIGILVRCEAGGKVRALLVEFSLQALLLALILDRRR